jgi:hypothetical protein
MHGGELADEIGFGFVGGLEMMEVAAELGCVLFGGFSGQNHRFGREAVFYGVERGGVTALIRFWTARFGSVEAGRFGCGRDHMVPGGSVADE